MLRRVSTRTVATLAISLASTGAQAGTAPPGLSADRIDVRAFHPIEGPSTGPAVYYQVVDNPGGAFLRGTYRPGLETVTMGADVPEARRRSARRLRWRWRAQAFPEHGNECRPGSGDSAASVFAAFKRGPKWYILKYVWSPEAPRGAVCDRKRSLLLSRDTVVLETDGAAGMWVQEDVDLRSAFIRHFGKGNPQVEIPDFVGVAVMTDGDQTHSNSGADWMDFEIVY